jgi:hypothetical protein
LEQRDTQGEDIGGGLDALYHKSLWRHEGHRPEDHAGCGFGGSRELVG